MTEIEVTIDGRRLKGTAGQTVLELALENDIAIPNLCHDPQLKPTGACRLCLVEVEGQRGLVSSCTLEIEPSMVVRTNTEQIVAVRKTVVRLLFYEHHSSCAVCDKNGNCKLQHYAYQYQIPDQSLNIYEHDEPDVNYTTGNKAVAYDPHKCIRCGRCIRICQEV